MAKTNERRKITLIVSIVLVVLVIAAGSITYLNNHDSRNIVNLPVTKQSPPADQSSSNAVTYGGGITVPQDSQARAKALGYYCPSWDAKPGQSAPDYCTSIDK